MRAARGLHRSRHRHATGRHLVEGPRAVVEALRAGLVEELYLDADDAAQLVATWGLTPRADAPAVHVEHVTTAVLAAISDATTPQGVVAVARTRTAELGQIPAGVVVVLDRVADPGNAGTVLRTADALGAAAVVLTTGSVDPFAPKTIRAAVGSTYHLPVVVGVSLAEVADHARATGRRVVGLDAGGGAGLEVLRAAAGAVTLVLGNEAHGLDAASRASLDATVAIELDPRAESLNVAAAAAIAIHAATRG
ncbi:MAG: TrmH family RNA methyltransferase [Nitriliruptoraceae bacterium]